MGSQDPFDEELQREGIEAHKRLVMGNLWKRARYEALTQEACVEYWVEQRADAILYRQRWFELEAAKND